MRLKCVKNTPAILASFGLLRRINDFAYLRDLEPRANRLMDFRRTNVRLWPKADVPVPDCRVCFRGNIADTNNRNRRVRFRPEADIGRAPESDHPR